MFNTNPQHFLNQIIQIHHFKKSVFWCKKNKNLLNLLLRSAAIFHWLKSLSLFLWWQWLMFGGVQHRSLVIPVHLIYFCINQIYLHSNFCMHSFLRLSIFFLKHSWERASCSILQKVDSARSSRVLLRQWLLFWTPNPGLVFQIILFSQPVTPLNFQWRLVGHGR